MKVLIVDDVSANLKLLRALLEAENISVVDAHDGVEALEILRHENVDSIISDILMPRMDGYRLCYEIRRQERLRSVPFIFYSSTYTSPGDEKLCYDLGGNKYLCRPAPAHLILAALRDCSQSAATRVPSHGAAFSEADVMKEYNQRLVAKLETRNADLTSTKEQLEESNRRLAATAEALQKANDELENRVKERTAELQLANEQLETFSYSVSHDLRSPLRHIANFAGMVLTNAGSSLDERSIYHLGVVQRSAERLSGLIEALLRLSRSTTGKLNKQEVDLSALATEIVTEMRESNPDRLVRSEITPGLIASGDLRLLRVVLMNLLGNAWKFTSKRADAQIQFGRQAGGDAAYFVRDNGAGFDMTYANKLFVAFQRLHVEDDFEGMGIGLATVRRIIQRHGGRIWAESTPNEGAVFYFTLGGTS